MLPKDGYKGERDSASSQDIAVQWGYKQVKRQLPARKQTEVHTQSSDSTQEEQCSQVGKQGRHPSKNAAKLTTKEYAGMSQDRRGKYFKKMFFKRHLLK